ncbi:SUKH-4 family immunity protein [Streptomyces sp. NPDC056721]|uniref:SUKH-4 family immunity protein n=1 Tax=unclassified Streptomyces TaxID=2593676 RepID=UPI0036BCB01A
MLFNVDHDKLANVDLVEDVNRLPDAAARQYGFEDETLHFLTRVGLPSAEEYELGFYLPQEFDPDFIWDCAAKAAEGWKAPEGVEAVAKIGNFPINAVTIAPETGVVYQYTEGGMQAIAIHEDISSLIKTTALFLDYIGSHDAGDEDPEYADARRQREVEALMASIREVDPLPFAHEYSEWVELFDNLRGACTPNGTPHLQAAGVNKGTGRERAPSHCSQGADPRNRKRAVMKTALHLRHSIRSNCRDDRI